MSGKTQTWDASSDPIHARLKALVEVPTTSWLWTPADTITFVPPVLTQVYGDGRALFTISTINDRPAYWIIRCDSSWSSNGYHAPGFGDFTDDILTALEDEFGNARCGYSGSSLRSPAKERRQWCKCEECSDRKYVAKFPTVDDSGGCSWGRMNWPVEIPTIDNPMTWQGNLLARDEDMGFSAEFPRIATFWERQDLPPATGGRG